MPQVDSDSVEAEMEYWGGGFPAVLSAGDPHGTEDRVEVGLSAQEFGCIGKGGIEQLTVAHGGSSRRVTRQ